jgi:hypothetical protein
MDSQLLMHFLKASPDYLDYGVPLLALVDMAARQVPQDGIFHAYPRHEITTAHTLLRTRGLQGVCIPIKLSRHDVDLLHNHLVSEVIPDSANELLVNAAYRFCVKAHEQRDWHDKLAEAFQIGRNS